MRRALCLLFLCHLGCETAIDADLIRGSTRGDPSVGRHTPVDPLAVFEPTPCDLAPRFDTPTERGWRTPEGRALDTHALRADLLCADAREAVDGPEMIARYTAQHAGFHAFISHGAIAHFYRMDTTCERALRCIDDAWAGYSSRDLTLWLEAGEEAILVMDAPAVDARPDAWMEVIEPGQDGDACGWYVGGCRAGLACAGENAALRTPEAEHCEPAVPPTVQDAVALQAGHWIYVDMLVFDDNVDLRHARINGGQALPLYDSGRRFSARVPVEPDMESLSVEIVDRARLSLTVELPVEPQPVRADGAACDLEERRNRCAAGSVCDAGTCRSNQGPVIEDAWAAIQVSERWGDKLALRLAISDPEDDLAHLRLRRVDGRVIEIGSGRRTRDEDGALTVLAATRELIDEPFTVIAVDRWGVESAPFETRPGRRYAAQRGEPCDWDGVVACTAGTVCESHDQNRREAAVCIDPARECADDWPTNRLAIGERLALDGPRLMVATDCGDSGLAWAELIAFTADQAGRWRFTLDSESRIVSNFTVRRHCNVRVEDACHPAHNPDEEGPGVIELDFAAEERVTLIVSGRYGGLNQTLVAERVLD